MGNKAVNIHFDQWWYSRSALPAWNQLLWPLESDGKLETERKQSQLQASGDIQDNQLIQLRINENISKVD